MESWTDKQLNDYIEAAPAEIREPVADLLWDCGVLQDEPGYLYALARGIKNRLERVEYNEDSEVSEEEDEDGSDAGNESPVEWESFTSVTYNPDTDDIVPGTPERYSPPASPPPAPLKSRKLVFRAEWRFEPY